MRSGYYTKRTMVSLSRLYFFLLLSVAFIVACHLEASPPVEDIPPVQDSIFSSGVSRGVIESRSIQEASGLAAGITNFGRLWTHNDSGDKARVFLMDENGRHVAEYLLENQNNRDWEDMASGPGPEKGKNYLYVGEFGDNNAKYNEIYIFRFEEPEVPKQGFPEAQTIPASKTEKLTLKYPDGPRDAECLLLDPLTKDLFIVTKRENQVLVYKAPFPQIAGKTIVLEKEAELPFTWITAGDISADGQEVLLKTYDHIYYWKRKPGQSIPELLKTTPKQLPYKREPQGEAIAWKRDGTGFYTTSEVFMIPSAFVYFYKRLHLE